MAWPVPPERWYAGWANQLLQALDQRFQSLDANTVRTARNQTQRFCHDAVSAAGTTQAQATQLSGDICRITACSTGTQGVKLPSAKKGMRVTVINAATATSSVYPYLGQRIGTAGTNAAIALAPNGAKQMFESPADLIWY